MTEFPSMPRLPHIPDRIIVPPAMASRSHAHVQPVEAAWGDGVPVDPAIGAQLHAPMSATELGEKLLASLDAGYAVTLTPQLGSIYVQHSTNHR